MMHHIIIVKWRENMWEIIVNGIQKAVMQIKVDPYWELTAFVGEAIFGGRFVLQWLVSEYRKKSHVPVAFWYMSIIGSIILLVYSFHKVMPVLIVAFSLQILIYMRNLCLIKKHSDPGSEKNTEENNTAVSQ